MTTRNQARIHTRFHRFAKIGQIFHKYKYYLMRKLSKLKSGEYPVSMTQKPKGKET